MGPSLGLQVVGPFFGLDYEEWTLGLQCDVPSLVCPSSGVQMTAKEVTGQVVGLPTRPTPVLSLPDYPQLPPDLYHPYINLFYLPVRVRRRGN